MRERISRIQYYLNMATLIALRSTCTRASVGAVLTNNNRVIGTGYNGGPSGTKHCIDDNVHGCIKDEQGRCATTIHAELNAILSREGQSSPTDNLIMYCTHEPCRHCIKVLAQSNIKTIYFLEYYPDKIRDKLSSIFGMRLIKEELL